MSSSTEATSAAPAAALPGKNLSVNTSPVKLDEAGTIQALKIQLDFYFSRQNLANDAYLLSHMDVRKYVPVSIIAKFPKVKSLTEDHDLLISVMKQCKNFQLDETCTMVKPNLKTERTTLILRDIPKDVPEDEVKAIFSYDKCGKVTSVKPDVSDTWYVTFETEKECMDCAFALPSKEFRGKKIRFCVKSEGAIRSIYTGGPKDGVPMTPSSTNLSPTSQGPSSSPLSTQQHQMQQGGGGKWRQNSANYYSNNAPYYQYNQNNANYIPYNHSWQSSYKHPHAYAGNAANNHYTNHSVDVPNVGGATVAGSLEQPYQQHGKRNVNNKRGSAGSQPLSQSSKGNTQGSSGAVDTKPRGSKHSTEASPDVNNFPALPGQAKKKMNGYSGAFLQYTREEMAAIVDILKTTTFERPDTMPASNPCFRPTPLTGVSLLDPIPIMYPASPSPTMIVDSTSSTVPHLDLGNNGVYGTQIPSLDSLAGGAATAVASSVQVAQAGVENRNRRGSHGGQNNRSNSWKGSHLPGSAAAVAGAPVVASSVPHQKNGSISSAATANNQPSNNKRNSQQRPHTAKGGKGEESHISSPPLSSTLVTSTPTSENSTEGAQKTKYAQLAAQKPSAEALAQAQQQAQQLAARKAKEAAQAQAEKKKHEEAKGNKDKDVSAEGKREGKGRSGGQGRKGGEGGAAKGGERAGNKGGEGKVEKGGNGGNGGSRGNRKGGQGGRGRAGNADEGGKRDEKNSSEEKSGDDKEEKDYGSGEKTLTWAERAKLASAKAAPAKAAAAAAVTEKSVSSPATASE